MSTNQEDMVALAEELWGEPNRALSSRTELRFGANGSKSLKLDTAEWYDFEANTGGGYPQLYKLVRGTFPTNGAQEPEDFWTLARRVFRAENLKPVAWWDYHDKAGAIVARVVRFEPKTFRQCRPDGQGGWIWKVKELKIPLYRLPEILAAPAETSIYLTEGEKHADKLRTWNLIATTNAGGAKKFRDYHAATLAGRHVILLPDNDEVGLEHVRIVISELRKVGARPLMVELPGLPEKGDVIDWMAGGGTPEELARLVVQAGARPEQKPAAIEAQPPRTLNLLRLATFLESHPQWAGSVRLNKFSESVEVRAPFPPDGSPRCAFRRFEDPADTLEAMRWLQGLGFATASKSLTLDTVTHLAARNAYHPVRDYLAGIEWDGTSRLGRLFLDYFRGDLPPENDPERDKAVAYIEHVSWCWPVSAVARIMEPGCKVDHLPILVGDQGLKKSAAIRALCRDEAWFSDDLSPDLVDRDTKEAIVGKWIIELAEIPHVRRDVERVKAFFSRQTDRFRRAYDRQSNDWPRQCVFIGTSNDLEFLDVTGNRRFWPIDIMGVNLERITADRDQLWAEAVRLYRDGHQWWLPPNIERIATEQQARFAAEDVWAEQLASWAKQQKKPFTLATAMAAALDYSCPNLISKKDQMRAAQCLKTLGLKRRLARMDGNRTWYWFPLTEPHPFSTSTSTRREQGDASGGDIRFRR